MADPQTTDRALAERIHDAISDAGNCKGATYSPALQPFVQRCQEKMPDLPPTDDLRRMEAALPALREAYVSMIGEILGDAKQGSSDVAALRDALAICLPVLDALVNEGISLGRDEEDGRDYDPAIALGAMATRLGFEGDPAPMLRELCPDYSRGPTHVR